VNLWNSLVAFGAAGGFGSCVRGYGSWGFNLGWNGRKEKVPEEARTNWTVSSILGWAFVALTLAQ
jgi:hypothetical protein